MKQEQHKEQNFYEILELPREASENEIKRSFRKLAKKYHPDTSKEQNVQKKFQQIYTAYDILSDPNKRLFYDLLLQQNVKNADVKTQQWNNLHKKRYDKYRQRARHRAEYYSRMNYQAFEETMFDKFNFHSGQIIGLGVVLFFMGISFATFLAGFFFLFFQDFNGSMVAGYFCIAFGGSLFYATVKTSQTLFGIWRNWFDTHKENPEKKG